jgi:hypothetical protein
MGFGIIIDDSNRQSVFYSRDLALIYIVEEIS